jgi:hypothetical protein
MVSNEMAFSLLWGNNYLVQHTWEIFIKLNYTSRLNFKVLLNAQ